MVDEIESFAGEAGMGYKDIPRKFTTGVDNWFFEEAHVSRAELFELAKKGDREAILTLSTKYGVSELVLGGKKII